MPRDCEPERFDAVVIATHSDQALALLADPSERERELLGAIPYQSNEAVLHTDRSLLPRRRRAWASWNYHLDAGVAGTLHGDLPHEPPAVAARRPRVLRHAQPHRPRSTRSGSSARSSTRTPSTRRAGVAAQSRHHEISGRNRTHYCGAYWGWGFHEDGVKSALRVVREIGARRAEAGGRMTASAIYEGTIRHRRFAVRSHEFSHRMALAYLDLDELDGLLGGRLVADRPGLVRFRRADYLGDPSVGLADAVRAAGGAPDGQAPTGPIRLLTQLRTFGHCFNPVSFYYCFTPRSDSRRSWQR